MLLMPLMIIFASGCVFVAIYKRHAHGETNHMSKRNCETALNLMCEYYGDNKLKKKDVRSTRLVDFEGITKYHNVNILLYQPKMNARTVWRLVYGKILYKIDLPTINMELSGGHCFYINKMDVLMGDGNVKSVGRYLHKTRT